MAASGVAQRSFAGEAAVGGLARVADSGDIGAEGAHGEGQGHGINDLLLQNGKPGGVIYQPAARPNLHIKVRVSQSSRSYLVLRSQGRRARMRVHVSVRRRVWPCGWLRVFLPFAPALPVFASAFL